MSTYYAYKPNNQGKEPMGTQDCLLFELKTDMGAIRRAVRILGQTAKVFSYINFYDTSTWRPIN